MSTFLPGLTLTNANSFDEATDALWGVHSNSLPASPKPTPTPPSFSRTLSWVKPFECRTNKIMKSQVGA